ncbi:MAG: acetolactate synthase small subunit [Oscillospiraceae bacterium]|jgi:acetolactate synthase-1/3 small subunit|nr:acetolactate synthase small subunit [Oscillospiraceae bacterium]
MEIRKFTLSIIVMNKFGVLHRISGLFSKRGYNIDSLTVNVMPEDERMSRIIMTSSGDDATREQIIKQLEKLHDVKEVKLI